MIKWIGILIVSPFWGMISTQLFLQSWLSFINSIFCIIGLIRGKTSRKDTLLGLAASIIGIIIMSGLLRLGFYILDILPFGSTKTENTVYWIFAVFSLLYMIPQIPSKIRKGWRNVNVYGSLEEDILKRKAESILNETE
jgi:hypothetical protein